VANICIKLMLVLFLITVKLYTFSDHIETRL